jgi:hypothetical protein
MGWERHFRPRLWREDLHYTVMVAHIDCGTSQYKLSKSETEDGYNTASPDFHSFNLTDSTFTWLVYDFCWIDRGCILGIWNSLYHVQDRRRLPVNNLGWVGDQGAFYRWSAGSSRKCYLAIWWWLLIMRSRARLMTRAPSPACSFAHESGCWQLSHALLSSILRESVYHRVMSYMQPPQHQYLQSFRPAMKLET